MKIKRNKPGAPTATPAAAPTVTPPVAPASSKNRTRVLLSVLDGKIDWEKMTAESRKQFEELFRTPEFLKQFGLSQRSSEWDPEQIKELYGGLGLFYQMIGKIMLHFPPKAIEALGFSEAEKNTLAEPTAKLADEYSSEFFKKHQSLVIWGSLFLSVHAMKFKTAFTLAAEDLARVAGTAAPGAAPGAPRPRPAPAAPAKVTPITEAPAPAPGPAAAKAAGNGGVPAADVAKNYPEMIAVEPPPVADPPGASLEGSPTPLEHLQIPDLDIVSQL